MRIYQAEDYEGMSRKAANLISAQMLSKPASVLGLATGSMSTEGWLRHTIKVTAISCRPTCSTM